MQPTPRRPPPIQPNRTSRPLVHAPIHHPRLLHHPQARRVLIVHDRPDVHPGEGGPEAACAPAGGEDGADGLGRVALTPSGGEEHVGELEGEGCCGGGGGKREGLWQWEAVGVQRQ